MTFRSANENHNKPSTGFSLNVITIFIMAAIIVIYIAPSEGSEARSELHTPSTHRSFPFIFTRATPTM